MKIILSPAKTFNLQNPVGIDWSINEKTFKIARELRLKTANELKKELKLSDKLLAENLDYIKNFDSDISYKAIEMYNGMAYKEIKNSKFSVDEEKYINEHLLILSAFYGVIKPNDYIKPYRLDFNTPIKINGVSLKKFWREYYNASIDKGEVVLNLASNEFSDLFDKSNFKWYDFDFFKREGSNKKYHSTISKKSRGRLLRELAKSNAKSVEDIKTLESYGNFFEIL